MKFKYVAIFLVLLCCLMGAASATEDVSADVVDASADAVAVDAVSEDVDDSVESTVVEDESVVVESASAQGEIDDVKLGASVDEEPALDESDVELSGQSRNDILTDAIQREVTDDDSFEDAFTRMTKTGYGSEPQVVNILVSPGIYSKTIKPNLIWEVDEDYGFGYYKLDGVAKLFALGIFTVEGTGDNVIFRCADGYNLDLKGGIDTTEWDQEAIRDTISHKNIIFDCDVILGSRSYEFTNCTFKKALYINGYDINDYWNLYYDTDCDIVNIYSFKDCTFEFDKEEIAINKIIDSNIQFNENSFTLNFDNCKFPVTAVDSVVDISSSEKGVVVIALTDNSSAPIAGATVKYTVNGGEEQTITTDEDGKATTCSSC